MTDRTVAELREQLEIIEASGRPTATLVAQLDEVLTAIDTLLPAGVAARRTALDDHAFYVE
ncbi:hypothetical protein [Herbiconiux sp. L3-i23]|uniref:hypothetical protein n=1 Tax=Herbiconiux sp. L3-i23 TaxID=2905871 RepID=UPI0020564194|nr:hypothetical protein [Herbiconiux sp. L3-i23]BDI23207.1 hypothetical protein L3i23_19830 [Herbiconiux sp. L3-i23]